MAVQRPASSPTVAIARVLRHLGLVQGRRGDFRVTGFYRNGERDHTYVVLCSRHAEEVCAAHADEIEQAVEADGGWCFRVSVRYLNGSRPTVSIANAGERIREAQPAAAALEVAAQPEPAGDPGPVEDSEPVTEPAPPVEDPRDLRLQREQAAALDWSTGQADLVFAAEAGLLYRNFDGSLRRQALPGGPGRVVADHRLVPLVKAGFLTIGEADPFERRPIRITADGRRAATVWRRWRTKPAEKNRAQEREQLRPLLRGREEARRHRQMAEEEERRRAEWQVYSEARDRLHAWEERQERMLAAWATVNGLRYPHLLRLPQGWVPTGEQIAEYCLDPGVVAELRANAEAPEPKPELPPMRFYRERKEPLPVETDTEAPEQLDLFGTGLAEIDA
ncbi:hypothetical protein ACFY8S_01660 [Streptomyces hygroscopicus]|uniref:hypothetical protein n=1 Tax=Streptomyces hygroscopicus TaxID=1912 RepID=UPI0036B3408E